jgi:hypothetical protein
LLVVALLTFGAVACGSSRGTESRNGGDASPPVVRVSAPRYTGYHMPSSSMKPTLHCGRPGAGCGAAHPDRLLVRPLTSDPARGDIVVFTTPRRAMEVYGASGTFVKRLVGLPGETSPSAGVSSRSTAGRSTSPTWNPTAAMTGPAPGTCRAATTSCWATTARHPAIPASGDRCPGATWSARS